MCINAQKLFFDVRSTRVGSIHGGNRGPQNFKPISSVGVLDNGEDYFIYRFILFWDGFQIYNGKQASGDGIL